MREQQPPQQNARDLAALVERARAGDREAFTAIYEATSQELYRSIHAMVRSDELTLDIQQDAYIYAFTHLDQLGDPEKLRPWLRAIAVNRTRSVLRRQTPVLFSELEDGDGPGLPELADESPDSSPELRLEQKENARYVREILDSLTVGQRMLVGMYYYEQIPVGKIAEDLGVSPGTVKTQLFRSRKKIEAAVRRLEERGVKLWGLAPVPFLLALLKEQEPAAEAGRAVLGSVLSKSGAAAAGSSAADAAAVTGVGFGAGAGAAGMEAVAVHVGRRFFQTVGGRIVLGLLAAAAVGGGVLTYGWARDKLNVGDVRPTDPVRLEYTVEPPADTEEDLTTEPPETVEPLDTPEDLTEPSTEPTEPTTEPTEPSTEPTEPSTEPTEPSTEPAPPTPPSPGSQSSEPSEEHQEPEPSPPEPQITEPASTEEQTEPEETTEDPYGFLYQMHNVDALFLRNRKQELKIGETATLIAHEYGDGAKFPKVYTDRPDIIQFERSGKYSGDPGVPFHQEYYWDIKAIAPGTATIYCELDNQMSLTITVIDEEYGG